ncbi:MAG: hypothetical protein MJ187_01155 [Alphaproteobacteria bacterium]|nr:hypothetical protein [Alphaproteobacteria bacterium]
MRFFTVSLLSLVAVSSAMADARLPVVDVTADGVSARAVFGETIALPKKQVTVSDKGKTQKHLVARSAKNVEKKMSLPQLVEANVAKKHVNDVLNPHRPSGDLWAQTDVTPLRIPKVSEFSVIRSDDVLPEENLDSMIVTRPDVDVVSMPIDKKVVKRSTINNEFDMQIARLNDLQRRADESIKNATKPVEQVDDASVTLSRMVVPMERDVIVRTVEKSEPVRVASLNDDMSNMSPTELRKAFKKTFLSENKHLSTYQIDDRFDVVSDMTTSVEGFTARRDLSEQGGIRPLEIKIKFRNDDSALSRDNYNLLTEYAGIVLANPTRAIQVAIPQSVTKNADERKLAARRLAIVEQALRDSGVSEYRILPVLSQRDESGFVLRMISNDQYETLTKQQSNVFGDTVGKKTYKSMSW